MSATIMISPDNVEVTAHSAAEINNLACSGYVRKSGTSAVAQPVEADTEAGDRKPKPVLRTAGK